MSLSIQQYFHAETFSFSYLLVNQQTLEAAVIDPVLDYEPNAVAISSVSAQQIFDQIQQSGLTLKWILETHAHADHLSAAKWLKQQTGAPIAIGQHITKVQQTFNQLYQLTDEDAASAADFDRLLADGDELPLGDLTIKTLHTPGHTPSCCTYLIEDAAFVGDTLFMPDFGTARCDFPGGDASQLYQSIQKILSLPEQTRLFMCHDYMPGGRELKWQTSVNQQKRDNIHIHQGISEQDYVQMRTQRDQQLSVPKLILPALQVNIRAGQLPKENGNGRRFLKLPINQL